MYTKLTERSHSALTFKHMAFGLLVLLLLSFIIYRPALRNGFIWDDDVYVTHNEQLRTADGLRQIWFDFDAEPQYYPMTHSTFWLEYHLWQLNPVGYHFDNILLHGVNAFLIWIVLDALGVPLPWLVALLFALHPVEVESVAWVTERKNLLSTFFYLLSLWTYLKFLRLGSSDEPQATDTTTSSHHPVENWILYGLSFIFFLMALFSKTIVCSLPAVVLILIWWKRHRITLKDILRLLPFFAAGLVMGLTTAWIEKNHLGAQGEEWALSFIQRSLVAGRALWFYIYKIIWPQKLAFFYERWQVDAGVWWQYLFPVSIILLFVLFWANRKRFGKGPLAAFMIFSGTLLPALGFVNVYPHRFSFVADHFQYLASVSMMALLCAAFFALFQKFGPRFKLAGIVLAALVVISLGAKTYSQTGIYLNLETLWQDTIQKTPSSWMAYNNLGNIKEAKGDLTGAIACYNKALEIRPGFDFAHYNLGRLFHRQGKIDLALQHYNEVLRINHDYSKMHPKARPTIQADTHHNLATIYEARGDRVSAIKHFRAAIALKPFPYKSCNALGNLYLRQGDLTHAAAMFSQSIAINPRYAKAHNGLGIVYSTLKQYQQAVDQFNAALQLQPDYTIARRNLNLAKRQLESQANK